MSELNLDQMEQVSGGKGGSETPLRPTDKYDVYKIQSGDNLTKIARKFNTTVQFLFDINATITDKNDITAGRWMYVPKQK